MRLDEARRSLLRNFGAHMTGLYGSKGLELLILAAATRALSLELLGTVFLADAVGGAVFRLLDVGLFPVLFRRSSREQAGVTSLRQATVFRAVGLTILTGIFVIIVTAQFPDRAAVATAFFFFSGVYVVHEIPRALLAGRERFALTASTGLATKGLEVLIAVPGLLLGYGVWAWVAGRAVSQLGMLAGVYAFAHRELLPFESGSARSIVREGLPFWLTSAVNSTLFRLDTIVVGSYLGLVETAQLGIAGRVIGGGLSIVGSWLNVSFPALARTRRRFFSPAQIGSVAVVALSLALTAFSLAPLIVRLITGEHDPAAVAVLRALTPVIALATAARALNTWLRAQNKERAIAALNSAAAVISAGALFYLVPRYGLLGAASARVLRDAATVVVLVALAYLTSRRVSTPGAWLVSRLPAASTILRKRLPKAVERIARRLAAVGGVSHVEVIGSSNEPHRFRLGSSDLDFLVGTSGSTSEAAEATRRCVRAKPRAPFLGPVTLQVAQVNVLRWARHLGFPVFATRYGRTVLGESINPSQDPLCRADWKLTYAITLLLRMQRHAVEDSRQDGAARSDRIAKDFRYLLHQLPEAETAPRKLLEGCPSTIPDDLAQPETPDRWLEPEEVARVLRAAHYLVSKRCAVLSPRWKEPASQRPAQSPDWLQPLVSRVAPRVDGLARALDATAVQLTPTGPTAGDPMLLLVADDPTGEQWLSWLRAVTREGPLRLPFRAYRWPCVLPSAALSTDALLEHAMLFHLARAHGGQDLVGSSPAGRVPPPAYVKRAALRETIVALLRIPSDAAKLGRERLWRPHDLAEPHHSAEQWRFRVQALMAGRLAALSLLLDQGDAPADPDALRKLYLESYDDSLGAWMAERPNESSGARAASVLCDWADRRIARLDLLIPD